MGSATTTVNTLLQNTATAGTVATVGQTLQAAGIMIGSGKQALTIGANVGDGTLTAATAGGELVLANNSPNVLTVNAPVANNSSASALTVSGTGTVALAGVNTYTGNTYVAGGVLQFPAGSSVSSSFITSNGGFTGNGGILVSGGNVAFTSGASPGSIFNTGSLQVTAGTLTFASYPSFGYAAGAFTWNQSGGVVNCNGANASLNIGYAGNTSVLNLSGGTINANGVWWGQGGNTTFNISGSGLLNIPAGNGLYSGPGTDTMNLNGGTLAIPGYQFNGIIATPTAVNWNFNGGTFKALGAVTIPANAQTTATILSGGAIINPNGNTFTINSPLSGAGGLTENGSGTLVLSAANTYLGTTTVNGGVLQAGSATAFGDAAHAALAFGPGSTGTVELYGNSMTVIGLNTNATVGTPTIGSFSGTSGTDTLTVNAARAGHLRGHHSERLHARVGPDHRRRGADVDRQQHLHRPHHRERGHVDHRQRLPLDGDPDQRRQRGLAHGHRGKRLQPGRRHGA